MKFYNVKFRVVSVDGRNGVSTITVMASSRSAAVEKASQVYRDHHNMPSNFSVQHLYVGMAERKFHPGEVLLAGC